MRRLQVALGLAAACGGAGWAEPWGAFPEKTPPDRQCSTGTSHGYDVYIWDCLRGEHVVVAKYSAEMSCRAPTREASACGTLTPLERSLSLTPALCGGPRAGRGWR